MRRALSIAEHDLKNGPNFDLDIPDPGRCIHASTVFRAKKLLIRMDNPPLEPIIRLVFEIDPDLPKRRRRFVVLPENTVIAGTGEISCVAVAASPAGDGVVAIFETEMPKEESAGLRIVCADESQVPQ